MRRLSVLVCIGASLGLGSPAKLWSAAPPPELITLDPICQAPEARNPPLAPGNPAPSTRRMAALLAGFRDHPNPEALYYMNDRFVTQLKLALVHTTDLREKFLLQFQLGIQQMRAGWPDKALNTFAALERFVTNTGGQLDA